MSRSADRLHSKASRRELRYEEHNDYIPPSPPPLTTTLNSIRCHPTIDHYARTLNQSSYFYSTHRRSQIEAYPLSTSNSRSLLPRPYSSNIPISYHTTQSHLIPTTYSSTRPRTRSMSQQATDNENTYGKLSECHSPLIPLENSAVKAPRRIETAYSQFPTASSTHPEPVYANTQSLYDNILYPTASKVIQRNDKSILDSNQEKKSCASQTQLTWTMATFSSFVDLENQSIVIPQTDPATLYSIVPHYQNPSSTFCISKHGRTHQTNLAQCMLTLALGDTHV